MFHCFIFIIFFCTVHWADLSWLTFHYWLYLVWLRMWRIIQKLEPWTSTWATKQKSAKEIHISCVYIQDMTTWKHAANEINTQAADITWMHAADKNTNCVHTTRHVDRGAHGRANSRPHAHITRQNIERECPNPTRTKTQDMSAGIRTPCSNTKQGTQMRERTARAHSKPRTHIKTGHDESVRALSQKPWMTGE